MNGLPNTSSAVDVQEPNQSGPFPDLKVTVNQTKDLVNQDISISWTGGLETNSANTFNSDYLQIFECWGDPETTSDPAGTGDPGPPPSQCEFGGESSTPTTSYPIQSTGFEYSRVLSQSSWSTYSQLENCSAPPTLPATACPIPGYDDLYNDAGDGFIIEPFQAVDGTVVDQQADYNFDENPNSPQPFWLNPYFSFDTTNEVDFARTYSGGGGQQLFQVDTGLEAPGLGCGQNIEPVAGGGSKTPQCWLVVVPRSDATLENPAGVQPNAVSTSPLTPEAWANRISIPLGFNPVGSSCSIGAKTENIEGGELASEAMASWEPALCDQPGSNSYSYIGTSDDQARQNITNPTYGSVGMSVFSDPIVPPSSTSSPVVYAPLTLSGVVIGFNIERVPALIDGQPQPGEVGLTGTQVATINLTPRLVAKLLTESYKGQFEEISATKPKSGYGWLQNNPETLFSDPDFLQYNKEFVDLTTEQQVDAGTLLVEEASSDAAATLWQWVLSDPEAKAWLDGKPDPWGMKVNPLYAATASANPAGVAFAASPPSNYPKSDPYCESLSGEEEPPIVTGSGSTQTSQTARPLCILDWSPYASSMEAAAQDASEANDQAKTTYSPTATSAQSAWTSNGPQVPGTYVVVTVTDSASAARYGLPMASLSRSGDDAPPSSRVFVAPNATSLLAGEQAMTRSSVPSVLQTNSSTSAPGAYPLTMLTYAASTPETLDASDRSKYATFIRYAVQAGQVTGVAPGQLPEGYVPLPVALKNQALDAAATILNPPSQTTSTPTTTPPSKVPAPTPEVIATSPPTAVQSPGLPTKRAYAPTVTRKPRHLSSTTLSALHAPTISIGLLRLILPIVLLAGLGAALTAFLIDRLGRRSKMATAAPEPPSEEVGES